MQLKSSSFIRPSFTQPKIGYLESYDFTKGCGTIKIPTQKKKIFVNHFELIDKPALGDKVKFELEHSPAGLKARKVRLL